VTKRFRKWLDTVKKPIKVVSKYKVIFAGITKKPKRLKESPNFHSYLKDRSAISPEEHGKFQHMIKSRRSDEANALYHQSQHEALCDHYHPKHYTDLETEHLHSYTDDSSDLNKRLVAAHHDKEGVSTMDHSYQEQIHHLDGVMRKRKTPFGFHVFTGVGFNPGKTFSKGAHMHGHLPAYTSSSLTHTTAKTFAFGKTRNPDFPNLAKNSHPHVLKIHVPAGSHGIYTGDDLGYGDEKEFVLPRNAKVRIHPVPSKRSVKRLDWTGEEKIHTLHVWHAKLIHDGVNKTSHWNDHIDNE